MKDIDTSDLNNIKAVSDSADNSDNIFLFGVDSDEVDVDSYLISKYACAYGITIYGIGL